MSPQQQHKIPRSLKPIFWDVALSCVRPERHRDFILARVLEYGDRTAIRWAFRTYSRSVIAMFLKRRGAEVLSERAWIFWTRLLGLNPRGRPPTSWRRVGRQWGGVGP